MKRHEAVVYQLLEWYSKPENAGKKLPEAAEALGIKYKTLQRYIDRYGRERFKQQKRELFDSILAGTTERTIAQLNELSEKANSTAELYRISRILETLYRIREGIKVKHDVSDDMKEFFKALVEIRRKHVAS